MARRSRGSILSKRVAKHIEIDTVWIDSSVSESEFYRNHTTKLAVSFCADKHRVTIHLDQADIAQLKKLIREHADLLRAHAAAIVSPIE